MNYTDKKEQYFSGIRYDWFGCLPKEKGFRILEIGCGAGDNGEYAKVNNYSSYSGIELFEKAAKTASSKLDEIICGDAEAIEFNWPENYFDVLFMSEVLEHLQNPFDFLRKVYPFLADGCLIFSSSPNVSHYSVLKMLLQGEWRLDSQGIMDETHLRWFTPKSYKRLFEDSGFKVTELSPVSKFGIKAKIVNALTLGCFNHVFWGQINIKAVK